VKCVEVKSANDRLSDQQRAWLLALRDAGVDVVVCKVM
jgi:Fanconi-associated nuclease 1